ncbi:DUF4339 domain-containing protein [Microcoleus sp. CAWBG58]|uniref:DUF4339 domain-containing protein n=1 Tax=Microcoleus sp. CAWBG58 TaxID=2841651 RepID=UPI0025E5886D|nr:DUF4339 domain-containing protein [Microcoleus sp. CAWBG58]
MPAPIPAAPEKYIPPHPALIPSVAGGLFCFFGLLCGWFLKINNSSTPEPTKGRSPKNLPPLDPVEQDLNQLKAQSGMSRMKTARRSTPVSEPAEWYVFRSGNAEGPYTKMQLLEVQKITGRTKVRRGETEWQRAGEISELVAYLTEK